jgi:ATP-dependent helicase HrpB
MKDSRQMQPLPIDAHLDTLRDALDRHGAVVLSAAPGAGKTTRVPPALAADGPVVVLQPRRVAARAVARRIADEQGWSLGREVGWHIRFERRCTDRTRVLVVTEGILTARLQQDPLLEGVRTVVFDEFHERSVHADLGLALAREARQARGDLRIVVMSATLDTAAASRFLDDCPVVEVPGRLHPLTVEHAPGASVADAVRALAPVTTGQILCFLPGAREIAHAAEQLRGQGALEVVPLYGALGGDVQDEALRAVDHRRVILATNIAETSLTVPGVRVVIDGGLQKVPRFDVERALDRLVTERVSQDAADQRAGRAGRLGPGQVRRLWDARERLRPQREPEIARVDLAGPVLTVLAWGADPASFAWYEPPAPERLEAALHLLARLGAVDGGRITPLGRTMERLPLPPRLARVLIEAGGAPDVALGCALLADGGPVSAGGVATTCDLLPLLDRPERLSPAVTQAADALRRLASTLLPHAARQAAGERGLRRALLTGYPDRVARRRAGDKVTLATGHGAVIARDSGVVDGEFLIALDVQGAAGGRADGGPAAAARPDQALVRAAARVEADWLAPTGIDVEHRLGDDGVVRALRVARYDGIVLWERPEAADPTRRAEVLAAAWLARGLDDEARQLQRRLRFAGLEDDLDALARAAALTAGSLRELDVATALPWATRTALDAQAPARLAVPSGREVAITYEEDGRVSAAVKLQELFGLAETPRVGPRRVPVVLHLLAPNGRPVQTTQDLRSFWERTYPEVRKELRGRYPKHPWPEDPWTATPTHRTTRRK